MSNTAKADFLKKLDTEVQSISENVYNFVQSASIVSSSVQFSLLNIVNV